MSAAGIRAGRAFVEMLIDDETVQASLENVKAKLRTFGSSVTAVGSQSFVPMAAVAATSLVATGSAVAVLHKALGVVDAVIYAIGNAARVTFNYVTTSVLKAASVIGLLALSLKQMLPKDSKITAWFNSFLDQSGVATKVGSWTRFVGKLTGSGLIQQLGIQTQAFGLGGALTKGWRDGGIFGWMKASFGAAYTRIGSWIVSPSAYLGAKIGGQLGANLGGTLGGVFGRVGRTAGGIFGRAVAMTVGGVGGRIAGLISGPISLVRGMLGSVTGGMIGGGGGLKGIADSAGGIASGLTQATGAARTFGATQTVFTNAASAVRGLALRVGGMAAVITGPALLAAKKFVSAAVEISDEAKKTGTSMDELIAAKFGENSLISRGDIEAGAALGAVMKELKQAMSAAWAQIGAAALPVLRGITDNMLWAANATTQLLGRNRELIGTVVRVASQVGAAAAAILALYTVFPMLAAGVGLVLSPLGLMVAAIVAVAYAFPQLRAEAASVFGFLTTNFGELGQIVTTTMGGIADALSGGNIQAAARVLWAGLNVAWLVGTEQLRAVWREVTTSLVKFGVSFVSGTLSVFSVLWSALETGFAATFNAIASAWRATQNVMAGGIARVIATFTGQDVGEVLATLEEDQKRAFKSETSGIEAANQARAAAAEKRLKEIEEQRVAMLESVDEEAAARAALADEALAAARKELVDARAAAAELKPTKGATPGESGALSGGATALGSFSTAGLGRQNIGGFGKIEDFTRRTAVAVEKLAGNPGRPLTVGT